MEHKAIIEKLEQQNETIEKITASLGREIVNIGNIRNNNKKIIAELKGKPYIDIENLDYNPLNELLNNGFISSEETNTNGVKGLITWIEKDIKPTLTRKEFNKVVYNVVTADKNGKVKDKIPYLKTSLKREVEGKQKAEQPTS